MPGSCSQRRAQARCGRPGAGHGAAAALGPRQRAPLRQLPSRAPGLRDSGQLLGDQPRRVAKSSARGRPGGPCCSGRQGGGSGPGPLGARETPQNPRALAPCKPPRLLPGPGLHCLHAESTAVSTAESGTKEEKVEKEVTLGRAAPGRIRQPLRPPRPGGSRDP